MTVTKTYCDHCDKELDIMHDYINIQVEMNHKYMNIDLCEDCFMSLWSYIEEFCNKKE